MESISQRIKQLIDKKNHNISSFEKEIEAGNNSIGTILKRNSNPSGDILSKILNKFDDVNANWLITGKGEMLISVTKEVLNKVDNNTIKNKNESILERTIELLETQLLIKDDLIKLLNKKIENLQIEVEPFRKVIEDLVHRMETVEDFKQAIVLLAKIDLEINEKEEKIKKESVNRKSNSSK